MEREVNRGGVRSRGQGGGAGGRSRGAVEREVNRGGVRSRGQGGGAGGQWRGR